MTRSIADISWDELETIARKAGAAAAEDSVRAGIATFGVVNGDVIRVGPDGQVGNLGPLDGLENPFSESTDTKRHGRGAAKPRAGRSTSKSVA